LQIFLTSAERACLLWEKVPKMWTVTADELMRALGRTLREAREAKGWDHHLDVERAGGPTNKTVKRQELGDIKSFALLDQHATALGLGLEAVLRAVLVPTTPAAIPGLEEVIRCFVETDHDGRDLLLKSARLVVRASGKSSAPGR
jgi:hypothetical protein